LIKFDVIVVGAGPAGSSAARFCAKGNLKTLLLEKEKMPREKRCAGGVSKAALDELDFALPEELVERRCWGMSLSLGKLRNEATNDSPVAVMVTRNKFDSFLAEKAREAGAEVRDGEEYLSATAEKDGVIVKTARETYACRIVIGADGIHSRVAKLVRAPFKQKEIRFCLIAEIPMQKERISELLHDRVVIWYGFIDMGYAWLFPKGDYISAGIGGTFEQARNLKEKFGEFLTRNNLPADVKMKGCLIPLSEFGYNVYSERAMITGDAAGFADAFSGEGIRFAIASGRMAAESALECRKKNDFSKNILKSYEERARKEFIGDLKCSARMTNLSFSHPRLILATAIGNKDVLKKYFGTMTGEISFREYSDWFKLRLPYFLLKRIFSRRKN